MMKKNEKESKKPKFLKISEKNYEKKKRILEKKLKK